MKSYIILSLIATLATCVSWFNTYNVWKYQWKDNGNGTITSRKYGTYPKNVEFKQGMNLMPGQTARIKLPENMIMGAVYDGEGNIINEESK